MALISGGTGLVVAGGVGRVPFIILLTMTLLGLSYNIKLIPDVIPNIKYRRIRDIPGSKTVLISLAWGVVTALFPMLAASDNVRLATLLTFVWAVSTAFVRAAFFDVIDMQGDRIVGKETIPLLLGEKKSLLFLKRILLFILFTLLMGSIFGVFPGLGYALMLCPVFMLILLSSHKKGRILPGIHIEFLIESQFILTGLITLIWTWR
jgi:4-hydroxy-3-methylbut-2-enyl diphosphate reductase